MKHQPAPGTSDLFGKPAQPLPEGLILRPGLLDARTQAALWLAVEAIAAEAPFARARTKSGMTSAAMTNCGRAGWWSDPKGYRYLPTQPSGARAGAPWPLMPAVFLETVARAVTGSPWAGFTPDACLINFYEPGARMGLHQDRDERDFTQPIITVSLGDAGDFLIGGLTRTERAEVVVVESGDVLIMGGASRMRFHGIRKTYPGTSAVAGLDGRVSLTFRKAL